MINPNDEKFKEWYNKSCDLAQSLNMTESELAMCAFSLFLTYSDNLIVKDKKAFFEYIKKSLDMQ